MIYMLKKIKFNNQDVGKMLNWIQTETVNLTVFQMNTQWKKNTTNLSNIKLLV